MVTEWKEAIELVRKLQPNVTERKDDASMVWRPIESAPKDGQRILVWSSEDQDVAIRHWQGPEAGCPPLWPVGWRASLFVLKPEHATHWMPLPQAPEPRKEGA